MIELIFGAARKPNFLALSDGSAGNAFALQPRARGGCPPFAGDLTSLQMVLS